jgi:hypothetical protein
MKLLKTQRNLINQEFASSLYQLLAMTRVGVVILRSPSATLRINSATTSYPKGENLVVGTKSHMNSENEILRGACP